MQTKSRVAGSGNTVFMVDNKPVLFMDSVNIDLPGPVAAAKAIHPMDSLTPVEIAVAHAVTEGRITVTVTDWWNEEFWQRVADYLSDKKTIIDVMNEMLTREMTCMQLIKAPDGTQRVRVFHGCKIVSLKNAEQMDITTLTLSKSFDLMYTHYSVT